MIRVFVYGTLRSGASNSFRMQGATSMGVATVRAKLYRVHEDFPGILLSENPEDILVGEVFQVVTTDHLRALDLYEGCGDDTPVGERLYHRVVTTAHLKDGESVEVQIWEYIREVAEADRILSGDWLKREQ